MEVVVNEWFLEYFRPDSSKRSTWYKFVDLLDKHLFVIVVRGSSPFIKKLYNYGNQFHPHFRPIFSLFRDSSKVKIVPENEISPLPPETKTLFPEDDVYLVELALSSSGRIIVTTDSPLKEKLEQSTDIKTYLLEEFIGSLP